MKTTAERVERTARRLDEKIPGWYERIDTGRLQMHMSWHCIGGQLCGGNYLEFLKLLGYMPGDGYLAGLNAASQDEYRKQEECWTHEVELRLDRATTAVPERELIGV